MHRRKKKKKDIQLKQFQDLINTNHNKIWYPPLNIKYDPIDTHSWFNMNIHDSPKSQHFDVTDIKFDQLSNDNVVKCIKVTMLLTDKQKELLRNWFTAYIKMYNETLYFIKHSKLNEFNFGTLRTHYLKDIKDAIINGSQLKKDNTRFINKTKFRNIVHDTNKYARLNAIKVNKKTQYIKLNAIKIPIYNKKGEKDKDVILEAVKLPRKIKKKGRAMSEFKENKNKLSANLHRYSDKDKYRPQRNKIEKIAIEDNKDIRIPSHMLDGAIKLACANYKSAITNLKRGHIKKFRIRYWRYNKKAMVLDIEKYMVKNGTICGDILGTIKCIYNDELFNLNDINTKYKSDCKIHYDRDTRQYTLLVPESMIPVKNKNKKAILSIDQGIRTFATGLSENGVVKIGSNVIKRIIDYLKKLDEIKGRNLPTRIYKKYEKRYNRKISNLVDDLHWKSIKYIITTYQRVLIGNLSIKRISKKDKSVLDKMLKRVGYRLKFYQYRQRLKYKCATKKIYFREINEAYTTKVCSNCGNYKQDLRGEKIYQCGKCGLKIDRDVGGSRGIFMWGYQQLK